MDMNEIQKMKDIEYANSLGYCTDINVDDEHFDYEYEDINFELTHLFDYEKKTKEYLKSLEAEL